jgi:hypothetical protein
MSADNEKLKGGISRVDVSLHCLTLPHIPRKFTRKSHLASASAGNRLFYSSGSTLPVGSIPIARSTLRSGHAGTRAWDKDFEVSLRCLRIHTYSHTRRFRNKEDTPILGRALG